MTKHKGPNLRRSEWRVERVEHRDAARFISAQHYAKGAALTSVAAYGLFCAEGEIRGAALFMPPTKVAAVSVLGEDWRGVLALSRLAVAPDAPRNAASFLLAGATRDIQKSDPRWKCLLTYADTWQGHTGAIYRACGWEYLGETRPSPVWVNEAGLVRGRKRGPINLTAAQMEAEGLRLVGKFSKHKFRKVLS